MQPAGAVRPDVAAAGPAAAGTLPRLADDLVNALLRHATGEAAGGAATLSDLPLATLSRAARAAFLPALTALALDSRAARRLAGAGFAPLAPCARLKRLSVTPAAGLGDRQVCLLLATLRAAGARLESLAVTLDKRTSQNVLVVLVQLFGPTLTALEIGVAPARAMDRRRCLAAMAQQQVVDDAPPSALPPTPTAAFPSDAVPPLPSIPTNLAELAVPGCRLPSGRGEHDGDDDDDTSDNDGDVAMRDADDSHLWQDGDGGDGGGGGDGAAWESAQPGAGPPANAGAPGANVMTAAARAGENALSDAFFGAVVARCPNLRRLEVKRATHVTRAGLRFLAHCPLLESLLLERCTGLTDDGLAAVLARAAGLKTLVLARMERVGDLTVRALTAAPAGALECLTLRHNDRVTDDSIGLVVDACQSLKRVELEACVNLTSRTTSHLSVAGRLQVLRLSTLLTNRSVMYLACSPGALCELSLAGCTRIKDDRIVNLSRLPRLRKLRLNGLGAVSQTVMNALGTCRDAFFPCLEHLSLEGALRLTDRGIYELCCQNVRRRWRCIELLDGASRLTNDSLVLISAFCGDLNVLALAGTFSRDAADRLCGEAGFSQMEMRVKDGRLCSPARRGDPCHLLPPEPDLVVLQCKY